jgi:hypothetical protein
MRATIVSLAARTKASPKIKIYPPLVLYKKILRAHQQLPPEYRILGDSYVKQEFKLHKDIDNPVQVIAFLSSWQKYLESVMGHTWKEDKLDMAQISQMSDQQVIQVGKSISVDRNTI